MIVIWLTVAKHEAFSQMKEAKGFLQFSPFSHLLPIAPTDSEGGTSEAVLTIVMVL